MTTQQGKRVQLRRVTTINTEYLAKYDKIEGTRYCAIVSSKCMTAPFFCSQVQSRDAVGKSINLDTQLGENGSRERQT